MSRLHWVALAATGRIGGRTITRLLAHFGSLEASFDAGRDALMQVPGIGPRLADTLLAIDLPAVAARLSAWQQAGISILTWEDAAYPANLLTLPDAPPVLFVRGAFCEGDARAVAIVGTRQPTAESARLAERLGSELAERSWVIVSGLALGIDAAAHRGALAAGGRTLAVLGSGVDAIYPRSHRRLAEEVAARGALCAEVPPGSTVSRPALIARNRITSGLSRAVIVVQSHADSGSANTARRAIEQGRTVFAVTGGQAGKSVLVTQGTIPLSPDVDFDVLAARLDDLSAQPSPPEQPRLL